MQKSTLLYIQYERRGNNMRKYKVVILLYISEKIQEIYLTDMWGI